MKSFSHPFHPFVSDFQGWTEIGGAVSEFGVLVFELDIIISGSRGDDCLGWMVIGLTCCFDSGIWAFHYKHAISIMSVLLSSKHREHGEKLRNWYLEIGTRILPELSKFFDKVRFECLSDRRTRCPNCSKVSSCYIHSCTSLAYRPRVWFLAGLLKYVTDLVQNCWELTSFLLKLQLSCFQSTSLSFYFNFFWKRYCWKLVVDFFTKIDSNSKISILNWPAVSYSMNHD